MVLPAGSCPTILVEKAKVAATFGLVAIRSTAGMLKEDKWAEVVHTNVRAAVPGGASALSQVALRCTRTVRKLLQLESLYSATEALTPHDNACTKYCMGPGARGSSMVGPAVQLFHVVASGFGAPEKLRERALHDVSSYAVMVTDTPI